MAVQTVPYALQNASHSAAVFRQATSAPFTTGGIMAAGELAVAQQGTPNMSVILGPGRAKVVGNSVSPPAGLSFTTQAMYDVLNDANTTLTITTSNPTNPRIDAVYIQVQDAFYSGASNQAIAGVVTGTPAVSPTAPAVPTNSILIAYVAVGANVTTIVNANISFQGVVASLIPSPAVGTTRIIPASVVVGSGTGTVGANGVVTFSGASSISINTCFTTTYDFYAIEIDVPTTSASVSAVLRLRASGADLSGAVYDSQALYAQGASPASAAAAAATSWGIGIAGTVHRATVNLTRPASVAAKIGDSKWYSTQNPQTSSTFYLAGLQYRTAAAADGFSLIFTGGTGTGTIRIYGWNNN